MHEHRLRESHLWAAPRVRTQSSRRPPCWRRTPAANWTKTHAEVTHAEPGAAQSSCRSYQSQLHLQATVYSRSIPNQIHCCLFSETLHFMVFPHYCWSLFWVSTTYELIRTKWGLIHGWTLFPTNTLFSPVWIMESLKWLLRTGCTIFIRWVLGEQFGSWLPFC